MIRITLTYEDRAGNPIPLPNNYPDSIQVEGTDPRMITDEMVAAMVSADLREHGTKFEDVQICWTAISDGQMATKH